MRPPDWRAATSALGAASTVLLLAGIAGAQLTTSTSSSSTTSTAASTATSTSMTSTTSSTVPAALKCKDRLLKRGRKMNQRATRCAVRARKAEKKGREFDARACVAKAEAQYDKKTLESPRFERGCLECTLDARMSVRDGLLGIRADAEDEVTCDPSVPIRERARCETRLLKALARYQADLMRCRRDAARLALEGGLPDEAACADDARARFDRKAGKLTCPACVDAGRIAAGVREDTEDLIMLAHCPCRFGDPDACAECQTCDVALGCIAGDEGAACGTDACLPSRCRAGACEPGSPVDCNDSNVCTIDECFDDGQCAGTACCANKDVECPTEGPGSECILNAECSPLVGCVYVCEPGCGFAGCN